MSRILVVLARAPMPGQGKTRLRSHLGDAVDGITHALVGDTLAWAAAAADLLVVAHRGDPTLLARLAPDALLVEQPNGSLGQRIAAALGIGLRHGRTIVQIGTDSPSLPSTLLAEAFAATDAAGVALTPADDGGWIASGIRRPGDTMVATAPTAFTDPGIRWSTTHTMADTHAALRRAGHEVAVTRGWYDVDTPRDLIRLASDPTARARAPRTALAVDALAEQLAAIAAALG